MFLINNLELPALIITGLYRQRCQIELFSIGSSTASLYETLQILSLTMLERMPINQLLSERPATEPGINVDNQLKLFD